MSSGRLIALTILAMISYVTWFAWLLGLVVKAIGKRRGHRFRAICMDGTDVGEESAMCVGNKAALALIYILIGLAGASWLVYAIIWG